MALHEPHPDQGARDRDQDQQDPVPLVAVKARIVVADHGEQHGQGEIGVVHRALATHGAVLRVGRAAFLLGLHQLALAGNDHEVDVQHHDGAQHGAEMEVGSAAREQVAERPGRDPAIEEQQPAQDGVVLAEGRAAEAVIDQPAQHQEAEADGDCFGLAERHHRRIDQGDLGTVVIDQAQQEEARDQGGVGFPLEPVQLGRELLGRQRELLRRVEAAAMHRPHLAADALGGVGRVERRLQVVVQPDEIEGGADPGDAHDHMGPAQNDVQPLGEKGSVHAPS